MFAVCVEPAQLFYRRGVFGQAFGRTRKQYGELCFDTFEVSAACLMQESLKSRFVLADANHTLTGYVSLVLRFVDS